MDNTKIYYEEYLRMENEVRRQRSKEAQNYIASLEAELMDAWGSKDKDKIVNISEIIEEYREKANEDQKVSLSMVEGYWGAIYRGTKKAWNHGYKLASDDIAYYLSQSCQWVTRELEEKLDYINIIRPHIFFSLNYDFTARQQQYFCKKKYLYSLDSFKELIKSNLKEVDERIPLKINIDLNEDEELRLLNTIKEIESETGNENCISDETVGKILGKEIELLSISALKEKYLNEQVEVNVERMKKKLYLGVKYGIISNERKLFEEEEIKRYEKVELDRVKNSTTIYNQQIYRYLDSTSHTKYHFYFNDNKKPLVLYAIKKEESDENEYKYYISKSAYREGIEEHILSKANIKRGKLISLDE